METWSVIATTICLSVLFKYLFHVLCNSKQNKKFPLPPGPTQIPIISTLSWLGKGLYDIEVFFRSLFSKYGSIITVYFGTKPTILISNGAIAHEALVQNSIHFSGHVKPGMTVKIITSNQHTVSFAEGLLWRLLRRNMATFIHPSRFSSYSRIRRRALWTLIDSLKTDSQSHVGPSRGSIVVFKHFQFTVFSIFAFMCFGENIDEKSVRQIVKATVDMVECGSRFQMLDLWPLLAKTLLYHRWKEFLKMRKDLEDSILPHIKARKKTRENRRTMKVEKEDNNGDDLPKYVDTLLELKLEEEGKRELTEDEMVNLCNELMAAGSYSTWAMLQWIMANIVKYPDIQEKLLKEIKDIIGEAAEEVKEEDLPKLKYLRAVVLEGLRRHPPSHFAVPRLMTEEVTVGGYSVQKDSTVLFMVSEMNWDPKVWEEPMQFKPERFLAKEGEAFDITCSREIKMMPFGAGRRICPGYSLGLLHLEYLVANLVLRFQWNPVEGDEISLTEKHVELFVIMKYPLRAQISSRTQIEE